MVTTSDKLSLSLLLPADVLTEQLIRKYTLLPFIKRENPKRKTLIHP